MSLPHLPYSLGAYYIIMPSEVSSNLARYDGMRYGLRVMPPAGVPQTAANMMAYTREAGFGDEVKRRIILARMPCPPVITMLGTVPHRRCAP